MSVTPPLRDRFLAYGARASSPKPSAEKREAPAETEQKVKDNVSSNIVSKILDEIADWRVPHNYFWLFYFLSVVMSASWPGEVLYLKGPLYKGVVTSTRTSSTSMTFEQVKITWTMLLVQGGRRMYESLVLSEGAKFGTQSKNDSKMWVGHLIMGLLFYTATSVAFWIEGIRKTKTYILHTQVLTTLQRPLKNILSISAISVSKLQLFVPSSPSSSSFWLLASSTIAIPIFPI